jgi:hypothetical protein
MNCEDKPADVHRLEVEWRMEVRGSGGSEVVHGEVGERADICSEYLNFFQRDKN